ncbi:enolase C-terminal domain-like protein [Primorskyibacter flagellatus]|uniref:glucarate dehydratase n=1 Tax=Primorskyibacter flagellatus TaxID=1387277 RepID=A0A1W2D4D2_9RHOB|nr:enolase C-terminal domain-like protein [Primorskyibacter flagellatus]SMC92046.1 glucarate dehydratase [Primorskyibacter flagellatus]
MTDTRIADIRVTPIAFSDPPLRNNAGCHQPYALRSIIEVETEGGIVGLGETHAGKELLDGMTDLAPRLIGMDVTDLNGLWAHARRALWPMPDPRVQLRVVAGIEVAMWDAYGKATDRRVCDLLGGQMRKTAPFSAYLFYKFAKHAGSDTADMWGEVATPEQLVNEAHTLVDQHGFRSFKVKAGVLPPDEEIAGLEALREAFPNAPLRLDPNGGWHLHTTLDLLPRLDGLVQYLEDPTHGIPAMATVQAATEIPLATSMCITSDADLPEGISRKAAQVILSDHHYWGGLQATRELARICAIWGVGLSMHSNSHLGISLAAMAHLAVSLPHLSYDCDTHYPWQTDEVIEGGKLRFDKGALTLPEGPGLGVTLDRDALKRLHQNYLDCGYTERDDASEMRKHRPDWQYAHPRF